jgi:hypothetical protein
MVGKVKSARDTPEAKSDHIGSLRVQTYPMCRRSCLTNHYDITITPCEPPLYTYMDIDLYLRLSSLPTPALQG